MASDRPTAPIVVSAANQYDGLASQRRIREYTQAFIAGGVILTALTLYTIGRSVPAELVGFVGGIIGWYFRDVRFTPTATE